MKKLTKRTLSLLLILAMIVSMFAALTVNAATFSYNTGKRGTVCTTLSSKAKAYYTGSYVYSTLSKKGASTIKSSLKTLMTNTHSYKTTYNDLKNYTKYSDATAGSTSKMTLLYSSASIKSSWDNGTSWNREHVWPQSLGSFTTSNCGSDLHHLRPADPIANSTRNNKPYGEVSGSYKTCKTKTGVLAGYYTSSCYEPLDNAKGDVARILLYCYVRWGETNLNKVIGTTTLLNWCKLDPVDTWEMSRNDVVQGIQGNRNVFIDYPEYAWLLFSKSVPSHTTPSGMAKGSASSGSGSTTTYTVTATTNSSSYGTVSVSGTTITASPKTGYKVGSVTVTSGSATTSISGNKIYVTPKSNCTIRVNFVASSSSGSSTSSKTFKKITTTSALTSGNYVLIVQANRGSKKGNYGFYALKAQTVNSSYVKAVGLNWTSAPTSLTASDSTVIWTLAGNSSSFTLKNGTNSLIGSNNNLYCKSGTATKWKATVSGGLFTIKNGTRYLCLRTDLALDSAGLPRFRCNASTTNVCYQFYLYKQS